MSFAIAEFAEFAADCAGSLRRLKGIVRQPNWTTTTTTFSQKVTGADNHDTNMHHDIDDKFDICDTTENYFAFSLSSFASNGSLHREIGKIKRSTLATLATNSTYRVESDCINGDKIAGSSSNKPFAFTLNFAHCTI